MDWQCDTHIWCNRTDVSSIDVLSTSRLEENTTVYRTSMCRLYYLYFVGISVHQILVQIVHNDP